MQTRTSHRKAAIFGWLAFVAVAAIGGGAVGLNTFVWQENGPGEAGRADKPIFDHFPRHAEESVLVQSGTATGSVKDPAFRAAVKDVEQRLQRTPHVDHVKSPFAGAKRGSDLQRRPSALVSFQLAGDFDVTCGGCRGSCTSRRWRRADAPSPGLARPVRAVQFSGIWPARPEATDAC